MSAAGASTPSAPRFRFGTLAIVATASLSANLALLWHYINRPPFVMVMRPAADGGATLQFIQPHDLDDRTSTSPEFHVDAKLEGQVVVSLDSPHVAVPGAVVELGDVTLLPGAFQLRFGDDVMNVMSSGVHWKGRGYQWKAARGDVVDDGAE